MAIRPLALAFLILVGALLLFSAPGLAQYQDWAMHIHRIAFFRDAMFDHGVWYPRWVDDANGGFGAPVFVFYSPLAYWLGAALMQVSGDVVLAIKGSYIAAMLICGCGMYALIGRGDWTAVAAGLCAAFCPFLMLVTERFNMPASALAMALVPWAAYALLKRHWLLASVFAALVCLAHILVAFQAFVLAFVVFTFRIHANGRAYAARTLLCLGLALALSTAHWLPAIAERHLVHTEYLTQAWPIRENLLHFMERPSRGVFRLEYGWVWINVAAAVFVAALLLRKGREQQRGVLHIAAVVFLMTSLSAWVYAAVPSLQYVQFAWRWLGFLNLLCVYVCLRTQPAGVASLVLIVVFAALGVGAVRTQMFMPIPKRTSEAEIRWALEATRFDTPEHRPLAFGERWDRNFQLDAQPAVFVIEGSTHASVRSVSTHAIVFDVDSATASRLRLRIVDYPGWTISIDGRAIAHGRAENGSIEVDVPAGRRNITAFFTRTATRRWAEAISLIAWLGVFLCSVTYLWNAAARHRSTKKLIFQQADQRRSDEARL